MKIPKEFHHSARGCEERATPGMRARPKVYPERVDIRVPDPAATCTKSISRDLKFAAREDSTNSGLKKIGDRQPRVARSSQPWAERFSSFQDEVRSWSVEALELTVPSALAKLLRVIEAGFCPALVRGHARYGIPGIASEAGSQRRSPVRPLRFGDA